MLPRTSTRTSRSDHRKRRLPLAGLASVALVAPLAAIAVGSAAAPDQFVPIAAPAPPAGYSTVWQDDFTGSAGALPSSANWLFSLGHNYPGGAPNWGTNQVDETTNNPANVSLDGSGNLRITPIRAANGTWTSARIETQRTDFQPPTGGVLRIDGRLRLPNVSGAAAQGIWPAFWALGAPFRGIYTNWPSVGEFDIMENVNGANTVWGTMHCGVAPGGPCNEFNGLGNNRSGFSPSLQADFHTYSLEWDRSISPQQLRWYIDGVQFHSVSQNQVDAATWANATNHGFFVILNVSVGGDWPGAPTGSTASGQSMSVDYVAVYQRGGTTPPTTPPPTTTPPTGGTRDAYATIEAESYDSASGIALYSIPGGGQKVGSISNGDQVSYSNVNFGSNPAHTFILRQASGAAAGISGLVEVRLDSPTAAPVGSVSVANTGGWDNFRDVPGSLGSVTGTHTVYLKFVSGQPADFTDLDRLVFAH